MLKSTYIYTFDPYEMLVVLKHTNLDLSEDTTNEVFESAREGIQGALYLPLHESQYTQVTSAKCRNPPTFTHLTPMKCL